MNSDALELLPRLPEPSDDEIEQLTQPSAQPDHLEDAWDNVLPPFPDDPDYVCTPGSWLRRNQGELYEFHSGKHVCRGRLRYELSYHYCLRKHAYANVNLIALHGEEALASAPSPAELKLETETALQRAQHLFAIHHIGLFEILKHYSGEYVASYGLPDDLYFRSSRNYFAHVYGTPIAYNDPVRNLTIEMEGKRELYEPLLRLVSRNIRLFEEQLADMEVWVPPSRVKPRGIEAELSVTDAFDPEPPMIYAPRVSDEDESSASEISVRNPIQVPFLLRACLRMRQIRKFADRLEWWLLTAREEREEREHLEHPDSEPSDDAQ
ncbi:hypothetical protein ACN47E_000149 [Coniothyrium glycines]